MLAPLGKARIVMMGGGEGLNMNRCGGRRLESTRVDCIVEAGGEAVLVAVLLVVVVGDRAEIQDWVCGRANRRDRAAVD